MEILGIAVVSVFAYLLGSFPTAYLINNKILAAGTNNIGAMNTFRAFKESRGGLRAAAFGLLVAAGDAGKAFLAVYIAKWLLVFGYEPLFGLMAASFFVVLGHCYSVYMKAAKGRFFGGKGLASLFGAAAAMNAVMAVICLGTLIFCILAVELIEKRKLSLKGLIHTLGHQLPGRIVGMIICLIPIFYFSQVFMLALLPAIVLSLLQHKERLERYMVFGE
ncbi:MAG: glycerol-3-phosphate acyltransferase [Candidatus Paceibacterota bacterium]|jgi:acyl-phosphate glycerol 3-phosphate acyltransferase